MSSHHSKEAFASVAELIGDSRLAKPLEQLARQVEIEISNASFNSKPAEVQRDLKQLETAARRLEFALNRISKRLMDLPISVDETLLKARKAIRDILALSEESLSTNVGQPGRPTAPGRITCAVIVIEAWGIALGKKPKANNERLQEACDAYWRACIGGPVAEGNLANWRRIIGAALLNRQRRYIEDEIQQMLNGT